MNQPTIQRFRSLPTWGLFILLAAFSISIFADEPKQTISDPGFRPPSEYAAGFIDTPCTATIAILPTLVRRTERTAHSFTSQDQITGFLNESGIATAVTKPLRIDLGPLRRASQWQIFEYGLASIADKIRGYETDANYTLIMELLVPDPESVFGIEIYIIDPQGRSAFSFLLNSHHALFADARLVARNSSEAAREQMIEHATRIGLLALEAQIQQARE